LKTFKVVFLINLLFLFGYFSVFTYNVFTTRKYQKFIYVYYNKYYEVQQSPREKLTQEKIYRMANHILWSLILFQLLYLVILVSNNEKKKKKKKKKKFLKFLLMS